jgi:flavin prenyltransferase
LFRFQNIYDIRRRSPLKLIVGLSGASGSIYALRLLEKLSKREDVETHLVVSRSGEKTLFLETGMKVADLKALTARSYAPEDIAAPLASGSYRTDGMVILPCSIHTMSAIAAGISSNLMIRAADVILKERRRLILAVRETPFHLGHLRTMVALSEMGAIIAPPIPSFYHNPATVEDLVNGSIERIMDLLGVPDPGARRWNGPHHP